MEKEKFYSITKEDVSIALVIYLPADLSNYNKICDLDGDRNPIPIIGEEL